MWPSVSPCLLLMSRIQVFCCSASAAVLFFRRQIANRLGAISFSLRPCSHPECQKLVFLPLPIEIVVHAANRRRSMSSHRVAVPIQAFSGEVHSCQSQHNLRALVNLSRFRMPKSPFTLGMLHLVQLTLHFPPVSVESPAQRNFFPYFVDLFKDLNRCFEDS